MDARLTIDDPADARHAAQQLATGAVVAHGFANFYAITARGDDETVRRVNRLKGRPLDQVGSVTAPADRLDQVFDWPLVPAALGRDRVGEVMHRLLALGPFGFRGPAAPTVGSLLTSVSGGVRTTQVIVPGHACPSNTFLEQADDAPAHWRAAGLVEDFGAQSPLLLLHHADEPLAAARYPRHLPVSTTILGFHETAEADGRPALVLERHGSLDAVAVRDVLDRVGLAMLVAPGRGTRLTPRIYEAAIA